MKEKWVEHHTIQTVLALLVNKILQKHDPYKSKATATNQNNLRQQNHIKLQVSDHLHKQKTKQIIMHR